jgi:hypothetical protein
MRVPLSDGRWKTLTKLALRDGTWPTQRSQQQSPRDAWTLLHSFGIHSHVAIYTTAAASGWSGRCG